MDDERKAVEHFEDELNRLIKRARFEYGITYAEAVGCLTLCAHALMAEANEEAEA